MKPQGATAGKFFIAAALAGTVAGCAPSVSVHTDYQPGTNFSVYKTYTLGEEKTGGENPLDEQRIRRAIAAQLAAKGLTPAQANQADLWVYVHVRLRVDTKVDVWNTGGWGY